MKISFNKLNHQYFEIKDQIKDRIENLFQSSSFINGPQVLEFEQSFSKYIGTKYSIGVSNGTDAIKLAAKALNLSDIDTVFFIPANTFISTIFGIQEAYPNAKIELVDCDEYYLIDTKVLEKVVQSNYKYPNKVIVPVHLYGQSCDMNEIVRIAKEHDCKILEDSSQAHGTLDQNNLKIGNIGDVSCFSLYPGKNLGAFGDAGIITTNSEIYNENIKKIRNLGSDKKYHHEIFGHNHRLDSFQAIILNEKLKHLEKWNNSRIEVAQKYLSKINNPRIILPAKAKYCSKHTYHIFCIRVDNRDNLINYLNNKQIEYNIHYPIPIEETEIYKCLKFNNRNTRDFAKKIISLPIHPFMTEEEINFVCDSLNEYQN